MEWCNSKAFDAMNNNKTENLASKELVTDAFFQIYDLNGKPSLPKGPSGTTKPKISEVKNEPKKCKYPLLEGISGEPLRLPNEYRITTRSEDNGMVVETTVTAPTADEAIKLFKAATA